MKRLAMSGFRKCLIALMCAPLLSGAALAQKPAAKAVESQPRSCGNLGQDNRPNACARLVDGSWVIQRSKCTKLANGKYRYTHCSGVTLDMDGGDQCCEESDECPGSFYVARCLGR